MRSAPEMNRSQKNAKHRVNRGDTDAVLLGSSWTERLSASQEGVGGVKVYDHGLERGTAHHQVRLITHQ